MKFTDKQVLGFSPNLKDYLCKLYNFIDRNLESTEGDFRAVEFSVSGTLQAIRLVSRISSDSDQKFAINFMDSIQQVRELASLQPTAKVFFYVNKMVEVNGVEELVEVGDEKEYKTFDLKEMKYLIGIEKSKREAKLVSFSNIPDGVEIM